MKREELVELRDHLIRGDPPYEGFDLMGKPKRGRGGVAGLEERKAMGDYDPNASAIRLLMEAQLKLIDHLLERMRVV